MKVFYHKGCADGCASAAIVRNRWPNIDMECVALSHTEKFPIETVKKGEVVWIVDFSITIEDMFDLKDITNDITWIDHHISAIREYEECNIDVDNSVDDIAGLRKNGVSGCVLTYIYCHDIEIDPDKIDYKLIDKHVPKFIIFIGDHDVWDHRFGQRTWDFRFGLEVQDLDPEGEIWQKLFNDPDEWHLENTKCDGKVVLQFINNNSKRLAAFEADINGYRAICVNTQDKGSQIFDHLYDKSKHKLMCPYSYNGEQFNASLYSDHKDIDCSAIAAIFTDINGHKGGGHAGAAGMATPTFPFTNIKPYQHG